MFYFVCTITINLKYLHREKQENTKKPQNKLLSVCVLNECSKLQLLELWCLCPLSRFVRSHQWGRWGGASPGGGAGTNEPPHRGWRASRGWGSRRCRTAASVCGRFSSTNRSSDEIQLTTQTETNAWFDDNEPFKHKNLNDGKSVCCFWFSPR